MPCNCCFLTQKNFFIVPILQESLQRLVLTGLTMSSLEEPIRFRFSCLRGLRSLSLGNVDFYDSGLVDVCSLPRLESLDLSNTSVTNLSPLLGLKERLRSLTLHQLKRLEMSTAQVLGVIGQLDVLQVSGRRTALSLVTDWFALKQYCLLGASFSQDLRSRISRRHSYQINVYCRKTV